MPADTSADVQTSTTLRRVPKPPMVKRTFYVSEKVWEQAKALADQDPDGKNISDVVRELLEKYVKKGGKR